ncbi:MAG: SDR family NAD(P)-dependent oxidoreductase [Bacteroidales bacterium]|jgi:short-subunit dehydrogenase|nr:SDR family NAD(P)-dependent oxidoreductase [Bacteroidales bacterium]
MKNNTVLITGATSGIGEATALKFLENSWNVLATGRNEEKLEYLKEKGAKVFKLDVTNEKSIVDLVNFILSGNIKIDILINNAGYGQFGTIEETGIEKARKQFDTNVFGLAAVTQKIIPLMRDSGNGRVINISSVAGFTSMPGGGWYSASKFAVEAISDSLRWELKQFGIKVVIIEPGPIKTGFANAVKDNVVLGTDGPYGNLVKKLTTESTKSIKGGTAVGCANLIYKAATKKNPKNRYIYTKEGKFIKIMLAIFPGKIVDTIVRKLFL